MFILAALIGIYSYLLFGLGLSGLLYPHYIFWTTLEFFVLVGLFSFKKIKRELPRIRLSSVGVFFVIAIVLQALVNLVGALGPELGFDALWYHLTIPKIWLSWHKIEFIPDGRYYYSVMPKLIDILYIPAIAFGNEMWAKVMHWGFGLITLAPVYWLARKWLTQTQSLFACMIYYTNLVVGWQSTTAYIDLGRTFFEVVALYLLINDSVNKSALSLGLAGASKLLALGSLPVYWLLLFIQKKPTKQIIIFTLLCLLVPSPWLVLAWIETGNPFYPFLSGYNLSSIRYISDIFTIFIRSVDPLNPLYLLIFPGIFFFRSKLPKMLVIYCLGTLVAWWLTPRTGGGRFILPYLPAWSVLAAIIIFSIKDKVTQGMLIVAAVIIAFISIGYRAGANYKYVPYIIRQQSKEEFLKQHLDKNFGDHNFYLPDPLQ